MTLGEHKILAMDFAVAIAPSVGLRNLIIHKYGKVDIKKMVDDIKNNIGQYKEYLENIAEFLKIKLCFSLQISPTKSSRCGCRFCVCHIFASAVGAYIWRQTRLNKILKWGIGAFIFTYLAAPDIWFGFSMPLGKMMNLANFAAAQSAHRIFLAICLDAFSD